MPSDYYERRFKWVVLKLLLLLINNLFGSSRWNEEEKGLLKEADFFAGQFSV